MKVSVIVSAFNAERYIENTLHSIMNQSYHNIEIILVDDGSTDSTALIAERCAQSDQRITVVKSGTNNGAAYARILGVKHAVGEWIMFVDADDLLPIHSIQALLAFDNGERDIISGTIAINGRIIHKYGINGSVTPIEYVNALLQSTTYTGPCAKLIRATLFNNIPTFRNDIVLNEDILMMVYLSQYAKGIVILNDLPVYNYIERRNSLSKSRTQDLSAWLNLFNALRPCIDAFDDNALRKSYVYFMLHRIYHFLIQRGVYVSKSSSDIKSILSYAHQVGTTHESDKWIRYINSPMRQRIEHIKYLAINCIKKLGRYTLEKTALIGKHFILEKIY